MTSLNSTPEGELIDIRKLSALELIELLDQSHPPRNIRLGETLEEAHRRAGYRDLIDELIQMREEDLAVRDDD